MTNSRGKHGGARKGAGRKKTADIVRDALNEMLTPKMRAFEAAERYSPNRHYIFTPTVDPRNEFTEGDRLELARKAWWLYNNSAMIKRAIDAYATLIVGPGLTPKPSSSSSEFNAAVSDHFQKTVLQTPFAFDVAAQLDFCTAQHFIIKHVALSGDMFAQFTRSEAGSGMVKFIPGEYVGNARNGKEQDKWSDGVMVNKDTWKPMMFRVLEAPLSEKFTDVEANDIKHLKMPHRLGYTRSPSWLTPAIDTAQDIMESQAFTKQAQKLATQLGIVIESPEAGKISLGSNLVDKNAADNDQGVALDKIFSGVGTTQLKPGESVKILRNEHPQDLYIPFIKFLRDEVAYALGMPPEMLFADAALTGPGWRKVLTEGQTNVERMRSWLKNIFLVDYYKFRVWLEIEAGRLPEAPNDWHRVEWTEPPDQTIDFGRDMKAILEMQRSGSISPERAAELGGYDAINEEDRIIAARIRRELKVEAAASAAGLDLEYADVFGTEAQQAASAQAEAASAMDEPLTAPVKTDE